MSYLASIRQTRNQLRELYKTIPAATGAFNTLSAAVKDNGPLSVKEKEYVALGMAVALRCEPCITFHVEALMRAGATR